MNALHSSNSELRHAVPNLSLNWTATLVGCSAWFASLTGTAPAKSLRERGVQLAR